MNKLSDHLNVPSNITAALHTLTSCWIIVVVLSCEWRKIWQKKVVQMTSETVFMYLPNGVANRLQVCKPESEDEPEETIEMLQSRLFHNKDTLSQNIFKTALAFFFLFLSFTATSISLVKLWNLLTIYSAGCPAASNWICLLDLNRYITNITSTIQNRSNLNQDTANWNWNVGVDSWTTAR